LAGSLIRTADGFQQLSWMHVNRTVALRSWLDRFGRVATQHLFIFFTAPVVEKALLMEAASN
jgi:hypothetical protein